MKTVRFKIFISYLVLLLVFLACMFPFVTNSVQRIVVRSMSDRADELIESVATAEDDADLVEILKNHRHLLFFRIGLINDNMQMLYDSHTKRQLEVFVSNSQEKIPPDVQQALDDGVGCSEERS